MIKYKLVDDPKNPGKKKAEVIYGDQIDLDDIVAELPGGFAMKDKYKQIITDFFETAFYVAHKEGRTVNTPLIRIVPTGKLDESGDHIVEVFPGKELEKAMKNVKAVRVDEGDEPDPVKISFVHDLLSNTTNQFLTPGGLVEINGKYLKLRPFHSENDVDGLILHFLSSDQKIQLTNILTNTVHKIVVDLPEDLPIGACELIIITGMFNDFTKMRPIGKSKKLVVRSHK